MAITLDQTVTATPGASGGTTSGINTTPGSLLLFVEGAYGQNGAGVITSTPSTTWTPLTTYGNTSAAIVTITYAANPTTGASQTFTDTGTVLYPGMAAADFIGVTTTSPFDSEVGDTYATGTGAAPGTLILSADGELVIVAIVFAADEDSTSVIELSGYGFAVLANIPYTPAVNDGLYVAYKVFGAGTAGNHVLPQYAWTNSVGHASTAAAFKAAAGGLTTTWHQASAQIAGASAWTILPSGYRPGR